MRDHMIANPAFSGECERLDGSMYEALFFEAPLLDTECDEAEDVLPSVVH